MICEVTKFPVETEWTRRKTRRCECHACTQYFLDRLRKAVNTGSPLEEFRL
jgi:hypothetical protein